MTTHKVLLSGGGVRVFSEPGPASRVDSICDAYLRGEVPGRPVAPPPPAGGAEAPSPATEAPAGPLERVP